MLKARWSWVRVLGGVGILAFLILGSSRGIARDPSRNDWQANLREVAEVYEIAIDWESIAFPVMVSGAAISGTDAQEQSLSVYAPLWIQEWSLYPKELIRKVGLQRVVLCSKLSYDRQLRTAVPDFEHHTLYLDVDRGSHQTDYVRQVIHHEFFHLLDYSDDGQIYSDNVWGKLNTDDFRYGNGGRNAQENSDTSVLTKKYPGFLNHYSTTGVEEDKAEIFAHLIVAPQVVSSRADSDPVVRQKVDHMKRSLEAFCAEMDESFWRRVSQARAPRDH